MLPLTPHARIARAHRRRRAGGERMAIDDVMDAASAAISDLVRDLRAAQARVTELETRLHPAAPASVPTDAGWWWADLPDVGATPVEVVECGCTDDGCLATAQGETLDELTWLTDPDGACVPCVPPGGAPVESGPCPPPEVGQVWEGAARHTVAGVAEHRGEILVAWDTGAGVVISAYTSLAEWREYGRASRLLSPDGTVLWTGPEWQGGSDGEW